MKKLSLSLFLTSLLVVLVFGVVLAVGDILTTSDVTWVGGNYAYDVTTNELTLNDTLCLQYRADLGDGDQDGDTDPWDWYYQDVCASTDNINWGCIIPGPIYSGYNYQWYVDSDGDCTNVPGATTRDWTPASPAWQPTDGTTAVTLSSLRGTAPIALALVAGVVTLGVVVARRRR